MKEIIKVYKDTYLIKGFGCHCYVLLGNPNIMIDAGCKGDVRHFAQEQLQISIAHVISTHAHFDHTGGNGYFDYIYMSEGSSKSAKNYMDEDSSKLPMEYEVHYVYDGKIINLGNRSLKIILSDVHAEGSIFIYDMDNFLLFSGDEIDSDQVLLLPSFAQKEGQLHSHSAASVERFHKRMTMLKKDCPNTNYIFTGHNTTPLSFDIVDEFIALAANIQKGLKGSKDVSSNSYSFQDTHYPYADAGYLRASYKSVSLVYQQELLHIVDETKRVPIATPLHALTATTTHYIHNQSKVNIGITSYGKITKTHINVLGFKPYALLTRKTDQEKNEVFTRVYENEKDFFDAALDIVDVCGANYQHFAYAKKAIDKGYALYIEKPIAANIEEARILLQTAKRKKTIHAVALINRFNPIIILARDLCNSGKLGTIIHFKAQFYHSSYNSIDKLMSWRQSFALSGGGAIMDLGIHTIDIIHFLLGPIDSLISTSSITYKERYVDDTYTKTAKNDTDEYTAVLLKMKENTIGILEASRVSNEIEKNPVIEIYGTHGSMVVYEDEIKWLDIEQHRTYNQNDIEPSSFYRYVKDSCLPKVAMNHFETMHYASLKNFLNIYHKKHFFKETPTIQSAYDAQAVITAIFASWKSATWEKISDYNKSLEQ